MMHPKALRPRADAYRRIPLPSPSCGLRVRLDISKHLFASAGFDVGIWIPYTANNYRNREDLANGFPVEWAQEIEFIAMASVPVGGGFQTGRHKFSALFAPHFFIGGRQYARGSVLTQGNDHPWVGAHISTDNIDYATQQWFILADRDRANKFFMNPVCLSAAIRYDIDLQLLRKKVTLWASAEVGLTEVYREHDFWISSFGFTMPGLSSRFRAMNLGLMFPIR